MTKIIIISDTHSATIEKLPQKLINDIKAADIVIHAGDADTINFIDELEDICKHLYAVKGNCDIGSKLPTQLLVDIEGVKIGINHGTGNYNNVIDRLYYTFSEDDPQVIVYGHTHVPVNEEIEGVWFINPGSTSLNRSIKYGTYAELIVENNSFSSKIINAEEK